MDDTSTSTSTIEQVSLEEPWAVLLWDDPVNTTDFVVRALRKVFGFDPARAHKLMIEAHTNGKTAVWEGEKPLAEQFCAALHGWTLNASLQKVGV